MTDYQNYADELAGNSAEQTADESKSLKNTIIEINGKKAKIVFKRATNSKRAFVRFIGELKSEWVTLKN